MQLPCDDGIQPYVRRYGPYGVPLLKVAHEIAAVRGRRPKVAMDSIQNARRTAQDA